MSCPAVQNLDETPVISRKCKNNIVPGRTNSIVDSVRLTAKYSVHVPDP